MPFNAEIVFVGIDFSEMTTYFVNGALRCVRKSPGAPKLKKKSSKSSKSIKLTKNNDENPLNKPR